MVTIKAQAMSGVAPRWVMLAPVIGVQRVLERAGWGMDEVDLFELNEAFSVQALGVMKELGIDASGECEWRGGGDWASDWGEWGTGAGDADSRDDSAGCEEGGGGALSGRGEFGGFGGGEVKIAAIPPFSARNFLCFNEIDLRRVSVLCKHVKQFATAN